MTKVDRESPIQRAIVTFLRAALPGAVVAHAKNEIKQRGKAVAVEIAKAKNNGMLPGFPDLIVAIDGRVLFFEVKAEGNYATPSQKDVHAALAALGHPVAVVRSIQDVRECLAEWGVPTRAKGAA